MTRHQIGKKRAQILADVLYEATRSLELSMAGIRAGKTARAGTMTFTSLSAARSKLDDALALLHECGVDPIQGDGPLLLADPEGEGVQVSGRAW